MIDGYVGVVLNEDYEIIYKWYNVRDNKMQAIIDSNDIIDQFYYDCGYIGGVLHNGVLEFDYV